uniref:Putative HNH homing endonuclease n=1 Tax=Chlamydomonas applanata TaxID=35704 RepID=A0A0S2LP86_CHLAP|nr:putative HNH homing endonuclease [Chlamydomonas applanata]ALO63254.1 putative HNH homing endonuclease [Chlamydomonas applanata]
MTKQLTIENFKELANSRNHTLISSTNPNNPRSGSLTIRCNTCNNEFTTTAHSYKNARQTGCPTCKALKARQQPPRNTVLTPEQLAFNAERRAQLRFERSLKAKQYENISSTSELKQYLSSMNDEYSIFMLQKLEEAGGAKANSSFSDVSVDEVTGSLNAPGEQEYQKHHIIPRHAGGPDSKWNLIKLTREDHIKAHAIRYSTYGEFGDYNFLKTAQNDLPLNDELENIRRQNAKRADQTRLKHGLGIYADGVSSKGGRASAATPSVQRDLSHGARMQPPVYNALYFGSKWFHKQTSTHVEFKPRQVVMMSQLKDCLAEALPKGNPNREQLENTPNAVNVTSGLSKVLKKERKSAYGWVVTWVGEPPTSGATDGTIPGVTPDTGYDSADSEEILD